MLGYKTGKYDSNGYQHLYIELYTIAKDGYTTRFGNLSWQGDNSNDHWYGFKYDNQSNHSTAFEQFMKFGKKVVDVYGFSPLEIVEWLNSLRGMKRLIWDQRLSELIPVDQYVASEGKYAYEVYCNSVYEDKILAIDERDARGQIYKKWLRVYQEDRGSGKIEEFVANGHLVMASGYYITPQSFDDLIAR